MAALLIDLRISLMSLIAHGRRTALLSAAIAAVTCMFVLLASLSISIRETMLDTAATLVSGHITVGGFFKATSGQGAAMIANYEDVAAVVRSSLPEMDSMVPRGRGWGKLVSESGASMTVAISGIDLGSEPAFKRVVELVDGNLAELARPRTLLVFEQQAKKLGLAVGDAVTIAGATTRGVSNTLDCRVVAIARDMGLLSSFSAFISNESLHEFYQLRSDVTGALQIQLQPRYVNDVNALMARLRQSLEQAGYRVREYDPRPYMLKLEAVAHENWTGQKLDINTWEDELMVIMWPYRALQGLSFVLLLILLSIMVAGIMNTLWIAIRERTREIGTLRAIGMQRTGVARLFLLEASLLGAFSATAGVLLGASTIWIINAANVPVPITVQLFLIRNTLRLALEPGALLFAIPMITLVAGAAALYPALSAARRKPIEAMAHFG